MPTTGLCSRCGFALTDPSADGVCPACGSRLPANTALGESTPASAAPRARPPAGHADTASFERAEPPTRASGDSAAAPSQAAAPTLPNYDELTFVGIGGMGVVYRAVQRTTERVVAVKFLHGAGAFDPSLRIRFDTEARALARVRHPHIVQVYEVGEADGLPYFSMEYIPGGTLARRLRAEPFAARESARVVAGVAAAVEAAHREQVLHRDIKPGNILLDTDGLPKITDFGLAKLSDRDDGLTLSGNILGTPSYMAPEQAAGRVKEIDARTDVYGLGATLYELLCGRPPFRGESHAVTLQLVQDAEVVPPGRIRAGVPAELEAICLKCLEKLPTKRYATAQELADDLHRWLAGEPTHARPLTPRQRARRWVRRHRVKLSAALLLPMLLLTGVGMAVRLQPRNQIERELAAGRSVTLIGETGLPRWSEWHCGDTLLTKSIAGDETCGFQTYDMSVLVLGRDPMTDTYQFTAELKQIISQSDVSAVGLFVGMQDVLHQPGLDATHWVGFEYTDFWRGIEQRNPKLAARHGLEGYDVLTLRQPSQTEKSIGFSRASIGRTFPFAPAAKGPTPWRQIMLDVSPDGVDAYWRQDDGSLVLAFRVSADTLATKVDGHNFSATQSPRLAGVRYPPMPWNPRGAFGVYGHNSAVAFRNVTLVPIPRDKR
jgi:serine/threonine-protein kinase